MKLQGKKSSLSYFLYKNYMLSIELGLILSLVISLFTFKIEFNPQRESSPFNNQMTEEIYIEEIIQTKEELKVPAPPRPVIPIEVPNDEVLEVEILNIDSEIDFNDVFEVPLPPKRTNSDEDVEEEIFIVVEQPPVLIGGINGVQKTIKYPDMAMKAGIEGRVIVQFVIGKNGKVLDPFIVRGIGGGCDEEAIRAVSIAKFKPGMQCNVVDPFR